MGDSRSIQFTCPVNLFVYPFNMLIDHTGATVTSGYVVSVREKCVSNSRFLAFRIQSAENTPEQLLERISEYAKSQLLNSQEYLTEEKFKTLRESAIANFSGKLSSFRDEITKYVYSISLDCFLHFPIFLIRIRDPLDEGRDFDFLARAVEALR